MSRTQHTAKNSLWGIASRMVSIFAPFIIRTIIIKELGANYLGLSGLYVSILQVLNMAELGISSAIIFSLYRPLAEKDKVTVCALMALYRKLYRYIGLGILVLGLCVTPFLSFFIKSDVPNDINIYVLFFLYLANASVSYLLYAYKSSLLTADQRSDVVSKIFMAVMILQYILQIVVLMVFRNYYVYYILTPFCTCLYNICLARTVDRIYPEYKASGALPIHVVVDFKQRVKGVLIGKICMVSRNAISSILLSAMMGLVTVAIYSNYFLIITSLSSFTTVFTTAMSASVGNSMVTETEEKNYRDFQKFTFIYAWITGVISICLLCLYQPFMNLWVGKEFMFPFHVVIAFVIYFFILTSGDIKSVYMNAKGLWWENRYRTILESVFNLVFSYVFIKHIGVLGAVVGPLLSLFVFNFGMSTTIMYKYCFPNFQLFDFFRQYSLYMIVTVVIGLLTYSLIQNLSFTATFSWMQLVIAGVFCVIMPNGLYLLVFKYNRLYPEAKLFITQLLIKNK
ncbi:lipopolysaccharide biosynthesis protein [Phocaeicola sp.]